MADLRLAAYLAAGLATALLWRLDPNGDGVNADRDTGVPGHYTTLALIFLAWPIALAFWIWMYANAYWHMWKERDRNETDTNRITIARAD